LGTQVGEKRKSDARPDGRLNVPPNRTDEVEHGFLELRNVSVSVVPSERDKEEQNGSAILFILF
jgi:hypothetical protein